MFSSIMHKHIVIVCTVLTLSACSGSSTTDTNSALNNDNLNNNLPPTNNTINQVDNTGVITLNWLPPTENTDGSSLNNLSGYKIYYGTSADTLTSSITINNPGLSSYVIENLALGNVYYFTITAINGANIESGYSNIVTRNITS